MSAAIVLFLYAGLMILGGVYAYSAAPPGASAATAIIAPGIAGVLLIACAIVMVAGRGRRGMLLTGFYAGLVLSLLFAGSLAMRARAAGLAVDAHRTVAAEYDEAVARGEVPRTPEARDAFLEARDAPLHDRAYLQRTLWALTALSVLAFLALLACFPRPPVADSPPPHSPAPPIPSG